MSALNQSLVCLLNAGREPAGGGVLISPQHILSCAHVVAECFKIPHSQIKAPQQKIEITFPLLEKKDLEKPMIYTAQVLYWLPTKKNSYVGNTGDIVVLELLEAMPSAADVVCLNMLDNTAFAQRAVSMCGFPKSRGLFEGEWLTGQLAGLVQTGFVQLDNEVGRRCVTHGFSGSPVWDEETQAVIGMISFIKDKEELKKQPPAYVIPLNAVFQQLPELEKIEGVKFYLPNPNDKEVETSQQINIQEIQGSNINIGNGTINTGIPVETYTNLAKQYGVTESAIKSFFKILERKHVAIEDLDKTLSSIAEHYKSLMQRIEQVSTDDDPEVEKLKRKARKAIDKGKYKKAEKLLNLASERDQDSADQLEKDIEKMQAAFTQRRLSAAANKASNGDLQMTQLNYAGAAAYFEEAVNLVPEGEEEVLVNYLNQAGNAYQDAGLYKKAQPLLEKSLTLQKQLFNKNNIKFTATLNSLANLYHLIGDYEKVLPLYQQSLEIREKELGSEHILVATTLNNLAGFYDSIGKHNQALVLFERSLEISKKKLGCQHLFIATILNNLAWLYSLMGEYKQALRLSQQSREISKNILGEQHPFIAAILNNLAWLYYSIGKYEQALPLYKESLKISENVLGNQHSLVASTLNNLAQLYNVTGEYKQALLLCQQSLKISKKIFGNQHPDVAQILHNLAGIYKSIGEYQQALPLYQQSLEIREKVLGSQHPDVATTLNNLAGLYRAMGDYEQALPLYQRSREIREKVLGSQHPSVAITLHNLAYLYVSIKDYKKALPLFKRAVTIMQDKLGVEHPNTKTMMANYEYAKKISQQ